MGQVASNKQRRPSGKNLSAQDLFLIADKLCSLSRVSMSELYAGTRFVKLSSLTEQDYQKIRHVIILDDKDENLHNYLVKMDPRFGSFLTHSGDALLHLRDGSHSVQDFLYKCGKNLETLRIIATDLQVLDLGSLSGLRKLVLRDNHFLSKIYGLDKVVNVTSINISWCEQLGSIGGLDNLTKLKTLDISICDSVNSIPCLSNLTQLTRLKLFNCGKITELPGLEKLTQLQELSLVGCYNMEELPGIEKLTRLTSLNLCSCSNIAALPSLENYPRLTELELSGCTGLTSLTGLENLTYLIKLNLQKCLGITELVGLEKLAQLSELDISFCQSLTLIPEGIRHLKALKFLNLSFLHLKELPDWLPEIAEIFSTDSHIGMGRSQAAVWLYKTTVDNIKDMSIFEQPYEMVVEWFKNRNKVPLNEIKVVFLGDGEAGKSHTIARLMNDGGEPDHAIFDGQSTPGIVIRNKEYDLDGRKVRVHYWDFGGQEIMHSMHRIFLTGRTMYVILLNARDDTQSERAKYWLHNVKSFAPNAPVLLVLNKIDQNETASVDEKDLRGRYEKLTQVVKLSAMNFSQDQFNDCFTKVLLEEIKSTGFLDAQWPIAWTQVKQKLENMSTHYIMGDAYQTICEGCQVDDNQKNLLHWFNDLGISFCCCDKDDYALEDYVILRPDWITNALYIILFNKLEGARNGLIPHVSIHRILRNAHSDPSIRCSLPEAKYNSGDIQYVLGVMRKFNLSFLYGTDYEFIPMLCQQNSTVDIQYYHKDEDILEFNMEFDYLPNNLLHRLMVERHQELDMDNVWRSGARFQLPGTDLSAVVTVDDKVLHIFIRNDGNMHLPNTYLAMLKANVDKIVKKMGIKAPECKLVYKVHGKRAVFSYNRLLKMHARGRREEYCDDLDEDFLIADILNQAAPAASEDMNTLLDSMISASLHLQGNKNYRGWDENGRNSVVRDSLGDNGYIVLDQNLRGTSETGKSYGELDLLIQRVPNRPWVLCEALIAGGYTHRWNEHLDKLLNEYNPHGLSTLFLLTYVDCEKSKFDSIWTKYKQHIRDDDPKNFIRMPETVSMDLHSEYEYIKIARCSYQCDNYAPIVYHIFVQMDFTSRDQ